MNDFEWSNFNYSDLYKDIPLMASYIDKEGMTQEEQIGDVSILISNIDRIFELRIDNITFEIVRGGHSDANRD